MGVKVREGFEGGGKDIGRGPGRRISKNNFPNFGKIESKFVDKIEAAWKCH
jgi:hypothetical protein